MSDKKDKHAKEFIEGISAQYPSWEPIEKEVGAVLTYELLLEVAEKIRKGDL